MTAPTRLEHVRCPDHTPYGSGKAFGVELSCCLRARAEWLAARRLVLSEAWSRDDAAPPRSAEYEQASARG